MTRYSKETRAKEYVKGYRFLSFARNLSNKYGKQLLGTTAKNGIDAIKLYYKKTKDEFLRNKIVDKIGKPKL